VAGALMLGITVSRVLVPMLQCAGGPMPLVLDSVRLIPCQASEAFGTSPTRTGGGARWVRSSVTGGVKSASTTVKTGFNDIRARSGHEARAIERRLDQGGQGAVDNRLLLQLGMVLGMGYVAFLTVWFWATRLRRGSTT
jgi:hypothetical protein